MTADRVWRLLTLVVFIAAVGPVAFILGRTWAMPVPHDDVPRSRSMHDAPVKQAIPSTPGPDPVVRVASAAHQPVPQPRFEPRDPDEWQGMRMDLTHRPPCDVSSRCGRGRACVGGECRACRADYDCERGASCVLQHCVLTNRMECRTRTDCKRGELCVLSGYSSDPRGNAQMRAYCLAAFGTGESLPEPEFEGARPSIERPPSLQEQLMDAIE